jgi:hypothetical protein
MKAAVYCNTSELLNNPPNFRHKPHFTNRPTPNFLFTGNMAYFSSDGHVATNRKKCLLSGSVMGEQKCDHQGVIFTVSFLA